MNKIIHPADPTWYAQQMQGSGQEEDVFPYPLLLQCHSHWLSRPPVGFVHHYVHVSTERKRDGENMEVKKWGRDTGW